jgi:aprataxin
MAPKRKYSPSKSAIRPPKKPYSFFLNGNGLGAYIERPEAHRGERVFYCTDDFVWINDLYPKSNEHCLLLPRSQKHSLLHPFDAFEDAAFLGQVQKEAAALKSHVAKRLQKRYGPLSKQDKAREAALNGEGVADGVEVDADGLPIGRDWEAEVKVGIHAGPSMNHLHVHVLSADRVSDCMTHRKHYNSFSTPFFVGLDEFPLPADDIRRSSSGKSKHLSASLQCWRCKKDFSNQFSKLKTHLIEEFEEWKRE